VFLGASFVFDLLSGPPFVDEVFLFYAVLASLWGREAPCVSLEIEAVETAAGLIASGVQDHGPDHGRVASSSSSGGEGEASLTTFAIEDSRTAPDVSGFPGHTGSSADFSHGDGSFHGELFGVSSLVAATLSRRDPQGSGASEGRSGIEATTTPDRREDRG
jgi:hypothetical protein